jgi:hypothetical protein
MPLTAWRKRNTGTTVLAWYPLCSYVVIYCLIIIA